MGIAKHQLSHRKRFSKIIAKRILFYFSVLLQMGLLCFVLAGNFHKKLSDTLSQGAYIGLSFRTVRGEQRSKGALVSARAVPQTWPQAAHGQCQWCRPERVCPVAGRGGTPYAGVASRPAAQRPKHSPMERPGASWPSRDRRTCCSPQSFAIVCYALGQITHVCVHSE